MSRQERTINYTNLTNTTLIIYGPTATGKTALALNFAKKFNGELISSDSRQVYKNLDIGTGKVTPSNKIVKHSKYWEVDGIKVNGFDLANPGEPFNVANYITYALTQVERIKKQEKLPIVVGGSAFYIKALIDGIDTFGVKTDSALREQLGKLSREELYAKLLSFDKTKAVSMNQSDKLNPRRLIRAIEVALNAKSTIAGNKSHLKNYMIFGLTASNDYIYKKSDAWLIERLENGLLEEIETLLKSGLNEKWLKNLGLEYRWLTLYLKKEVSYQEAIDRLKGDTHNFIRRQKSWFKQFPKIKIYNVESEGYLEQIEADIKKVLLGRE